MSLATPDAKGPLRRERLRTARLYFCCDARPGGEDPEPLLRAALNGGVDIVQLREKSLPRREIERSALTFRRLCDTYSALFIVNDDPDLARACDADGVHVGQEDMAAAEVREAVGPDAIVGLSTHSEEQIAASAEQPVDYISVGPGLGDADQGGPPRRRPRADLATPPPARPTPSSRSAASTHPTRRRWSRPARGGSAWCGRSATPRTRPRSPKSCAAPSREPGEVAPGG